MKNQKNSLIGIVITIIILISLVIISNFKAEKFGRFVNTTNKIVVLFQNGFTYFKNKIEGNQAFFVDVEKVKNENYELQQKNIYLQNKLNEIEIIKAENSTLKQYLGLTDKYLKYKTVPGYVIQRDTSNYGRTIVINVGKKDGIETGMTVVADNGLVGHVISVSDNTSKVQSIIDTATTVSSTISNTRDSIIVRGSLDSETTLKATYLPTDTEILEGDTVETSGLGGIYPKGIYIGKIIKIVNTKNATNRYAIVETGVDFYNLETVLVIKTD